MARKASGLASPSSESRGVQYVVSEIVLALDDRERGGGHLADPAEERAVVVVEEAEAQVFVHLLLVDLARERLVLQDRLDLRREDDAAAVARVEQRLDTEVIAREHELRGAAVRSSRIASPHMPLKRRKQSVPHSAYAWSTTSVSQVVWNVWPSALQLGAQLAEVVDLAVVDDLRAGRRPSTSAERRARDR